jgi:hypothetical protein
LRENILKNKQIDKDTQTKTIIFLSKAKNIINDVINSSKNIDNNNENNSLISELKNINKNLKNISQQPSEISSEYNSSNSLQNNKYYSEYKLSKTKLVEDTSIQEREFQPYIQSYQSEHYQGILNPLKKRIVYKNIVINTEFRDNYYNSTSTNFSIFLPTQFNNVIEMKLSNIEFPNYYYTVSKAYGNNFFNITVNDKLKTVIIPDGMYDMVSITTAINTALSYLGAPFNSVNFNVDIAESTIITSYLVGTGRMFVGPKDNTITSIELNFQLDINGNPDFNTQLLLKLGWILGFRNGKYVESLNYISEAPINTNGTKYIYLILDDYNNNVIKNYYGLLNSSILNNNILGIFCLLDTKPYSFYNDNLSTNNSAPPRVYLGPVNIYNMNIQVTDEYGRIIDLNNTDFSFTLTLTCLYDI